ncbi:MAG: ATP-binding protein [Oscillospiraceae bacterium]|nr:ATP-binding protein [Oscillospiraceae bacterium]
MKDLSLSILDIVMNSVKAEASLIEITLEDDGNLFSVHIADNGCGMDEAFLARVTDPFTTTRTTRNVGMGVPLFKLAAEQAGGTFSITSEPGKGTELTASFEQNHLDKPPLGDMAATVTTLIQGSPDVDFSYRHATPKGEASLDTRELRETLDGVPLDTPDVLSWIQDSLCEEERMIQT